MKYFGILFLLFAINIVAQNVNKGRISLSFNGEKIDLPISTVTMKKGKNIKISARAEINNEKIQKVIALDLTLTELSLDKIKPERVDDFKLEVRSKREIKSSKGIVMHSEKSFLISLAEKNWILEFSLSEGGEQLTWKNLRGITIRLNITNIVFIDNSVRISGEFAASLKSGFKYFSKKEIAKITNGKFEIII